MSGRRNPCPGLWMTPVIRHDGELLVCCADVGGTIEVGNLRDASFRALWEGERMQRYRRWHVRGEFHRMPTCAACGGIAFYELDADQVREWCELVGDPESWERYRARMGLG